MYAELLNYLFHLFLQLRSQTKIHGVYTFNLHFIRCARIFKVQIIL